MMAQTGVAYTNVPETHVGPVYVNRCSQLIFPSYEIDPGSGYEQTFIEWLFVMLAEYLPKGEEVLVRTGKYFFQGKIVREPVVLIDGDTGQWRITALVRWLLEDGTVCEHEVPVKGIHPRQAFIF
jgi:hypothetical protein